MAADHASRLSEETPAPVTVAKGGGGSSEAKNGETPAPINRKRLRKGFRGAHTEKDNCREGMQA